MAWDRELAESFDVPVAPLNQPQLIWESGFNAQLDLPTRVGELLLLGAGTAGVNALDPTTGEIVWQASAGFRAIEDDVLDLRVVHVGEDDVVARSSREIWVTDLDTGEELWRTPAQNPVVTVLGDDRLVVSERVGRGRAALLDRREGDAVTEVQGALDARAAPAAGLALIRTVDAMQAVDADGVQQWNVPLRSGSLMTVLDEVVVIDQPDELDGDQVVGLDLDDGSQLWQSEVSDLIELSGVSADLVAVRFQNVDVIVRGDDSAVAHELTGDDRTIDGLLDDHAGLSLDILVGGRVVARSVEDGAIKWPTVIEGARAVMATDELAIVLTQSEVIGIDIQAGVESWRVEIGIDGQGLAPLEEGFVVTGTRGDENGVIEAYRLGSGGGGAASKV